MKTTRPFGTWPSALTTDVLSSASPRFGEPKLLCDHVLWTQSIPEEKGRMGIFVWHDGEIQSVLPAPFDARSKVHEYGGGALEAKGDSVFFVNGADQQIYSFNWQSAAAPKVITQLPECRFADLKLVESRNSLLAVCEDHRCSPPAASVVDIDLATGKITTLATGADFYAGLCVSPCETKAACVQWYHPNMPWDVTELVELDLTTGTHRVVIDKSTCAALIQPGFGPDGTLYCVSDQSNWWNLIRAEDREAIFEAAIECATPQWVFGMRNWGFISASEIVISATQDGAWQLYRIDLAASKGELDDQAFVELNNEFNSYSNLHCDNGRLACLAAGPKHAPRPILVDTKRTAVTHLFSLPIVVAEQDIAVPESQRLTLPSGEQVHYWYYPPTHSQYQGAEDDLPPLIVLGHGGPTGAADTALNLKIQYWTQRGFAVADVNYRGSTGFGRDYRDRLKTQWGVFDVEDLCATAEALVAKGLAHPEQKIIKGSSAGGYSVLAALTQHRTFNAGVSFYGVADLEALAKHTHKFEAHYLDSLIGPYPEAIEVYQQRSPINNITSLSCPIFIAQGSDDKVVPPEQAQMIVAAAKAQGVAVHYCLFEGEGHGFRKSATLQELFTRELAFYVETFALGAKPR